MPTRKVPAPNVTGLIAYVAAYNEVGAAPPGVLSGVSVVSGA